MRYGLRWVHKVSNPRDPATGEIPISGSFAPSIDVQRMLDAIPLFETRDTRYVSAFARFVGWLDKGERFWLARHESGGKICLFFTARHPCHALILVPLSNVTRILQVDNVAELPIGAMSLRCADVDYAVDSAEHAHGVCAELGLGGTIYVHTGNGSLRYYATATRDGWRV